MKGSKFGDGFDLVIFEFVAREKRRYPDAAFCLTGVTFACARTALSRTSISGTANRCSRRYARSM
ncbi:hypothetical protein B5V02_32195 [Mesorhizobium kowhaii]|uniref:Uncharacterized protein n=1 Tax=Mesorhizobium kowhaii TaxID=1300272 RepID=A0A2W7BU96_9HYPH|nr:hypothetical protein B5V02_32195 [Mesorhizobium kowhaii]